VLSYAWKPTRKPKRRKVLKIRRNAKTNRMMKRMGLARHNRSPLNSKNSTEEAYC